LAVDLGADIIDLLFYASENLGELVEDEVVEGVIETVEYTKDRGVLVSFDPMDTPRGDLDFVLCMYEAAVDSGADRVRVLDTVGTCSPAAWRYLIRRVKETIPDTPIGVHCHNDFGHGMANLFVGVEEGVEIVDCTINGLGERAGNPDTAVVATALEALYGVETGVKLEKLYDLAKLVEDLSKSPIPSKNPLTGEVVFQHSAHDVDRRAFPWAWDAINPGVVGRREQLPLLGKLTGPSSVKTWLDKMGITVPNGKISKIVSLINREAELRKRVLEEEDLLRILREIG